MTIEELYMLISREISNSFNLSKDIIQERLLSGTNETMTEHEIYSQMIIQSIPISANLSAQAVLKVLTSLELLSSDELASLKLHPKLRLLQTPKEIISPFPPSEDLKE